MNLEIAIHVTTRIDVKDESVSDSKVLSSNVVGIFVIVDSVDFHVFDVSVDSGVFDVSVSFDGFVVYNFSVKT